MFRIVPFNSLLLSSTVLASGLLAGPLAARNAQAAFSGCGSDPVVTLSNRVQIRLSEHIDNLASDISGITYQLHIPVGTRVRSISYSGAVPSSLQTITISADERAGTYDAYTVVNTYARRILVTASMAGTSPNQTTIVSSPTTGLSGQTLHSHLYLL